MNISQSGRVVVIDDNKKEAYPLIETLSKKGIPSTYFSSEIEQLPDKPLSGIRIVFLDIELGTIGQPDETKISTAIGILNRIISSDNGPYMIIGWTKHADLLKKLKTKIKKNRPIFFLDLEKSKCFETRNKRKTCNLAQLEENISRELKKSSAFQILTLWENIAHYCAGEMVASISSLSKPSTKWDKNICEIFYALSFAQLANHLNIEDSNEMIQNALITINYALTDVFEKKISSPEFNSAGKDLKTILNLSDLRESVIDKKTRGKINSMLLLSISETADFPQPGTLYEFSRRNFPLKVDDLFNGELETYPKRDQLLRKVKKIILEATPTCDYANKKWKKHRFLLGFLWPVEFSNKIKTGDSSCKSPIIEYNLKRYKLVFDFRYLMTAEFEEFKNNKRNYSLKHRKKPLCQIRHQLLVDIQSRLSRHVNRPGIVNV